MPPSDDSTSLPISLVSSIILPIFTFALGVILTRYYQKLDNRREKAKDILSFFREKGKIIVNSELEKITGEYILFVDYYPVNVNTGIDSLNCIKLSLNENIRSGLILSPYFKMDEKGHLIMVYKNNRHFNKYGKKIIRCVNEHSENIKKMQVLLDNVMEKSYISSFDSLDFKNMIIKTNQDKLIQQNIIQIEKNGLFVIFVCCLFGSMNSYRSGSRAMVEILTQKPNELKHSIASYDKMSKLFDEIQQMREKTENNLQKLTQTISDLCEDFQRIYDI